jgi:hypothetical protein
MPIETDDQRNARLEAEIKARPDYKQIEDEFNLKGTVPAGTGSESERERIYKARDGTAEIGGDIATATPDSELTPALLAKKREFESQFGAPSTAAPPVTPPAPPAAEVGPELSPENIEAEARAGAEEAAAQLTDEFGASAPEVIVRAQRVAEEFRSSPDFDWEAMVVHHLIPRFGQASVVRALYELQRGKK